MNDWRATMTRYNEVHDIDSFDYPGGYCDGVDAVWSYVGCLHPETTLEDVIESIRSAIEEKII
ncbi:hypothetical protein SEA_WATERT_54 [Microbacterium phage WaterT]|nr:hypothetical protein SEA_WATERT_54 [Microbacterium phage WaterT]